MEESEKIGVELLKKAKQNLEELEVVLSKNPRRNVDGTLKSFLDVANQGVEEVAKEIRKATNAIDVLVQYGKGKVFWGLGKYAEAIICFRTAAEGGHEESKNEIRICISKAEETNDSVFQYEIGRCYLDGFCVDADPFKAVRYFEKSASLGNADAQDALGWCYENNIGVEMKDSEKAFALYQQAAEQENTKAEVSLGRCYFEGIGVEPNYEEAVKWFTKAAENGNHWAQDKLGWCYEKALGVEQNYEEAFKWYKKAAEQGNVAAWNSLGGCFFNGRGVLQDYYAAARWFEKAAEKGNHWAQYGLAKCYISGYGVAQSYEEAIELYQKAADQGNPCAKQELENIWAGNETLNAALKKLDTLIGLETIKKDVRELVKYRQIQVMRSLRGLKKSNLSYHCILLGNPGTGKTITARMLTEIYYAMGIIKNRRIVETDRSGLVGEYIGHTAAKTNRIINRALGGVLFIDEAYSLAVNSKKDFGHEAIATLLKRMEDDRDRLVVILAGYSKEMLDLLDSNSGLKSRFNHYFNLPDYTADELAGIFKYMATQEQYTCDTELQRALPGIMRDAMSKSDANFGAARFVRNLLENTIRRQAARVSSYEYISDESSRN